MNKPIFISYSSRDSSFVEKLANDLVQSGADVWFDKFEILVGDSIPGKISDGLKRCDFFIIVLSKKSIRSKWVFSELETAINEKHAGHIKKICPILKEKCQIPMLLRSIRYADCSHDYDSGLKELLKALGLKPPRIPEQNGELLEVLRGYSRQWLKDDFTVQAHAEWSFINLYRENERKGEVFVSVIHEYLLSLLIYKRDIYTEDRIRVAARVVETCGFSDARFVPVFIQLLEQLALHGTHSKPIYDVAKALRTCWDSKYVHELRKVVETYPRLAPIEMYIK